MPRTHRARENRHRFEGLGEPTLPILLCAPPLVGGVCDSSPAYFAGSSTFNPSEGDFENLVRGERRRGDVTYVHLTGVCHPYEQAVSTF